MSGSTEHEWPKTTPAGHVYTAPTTYEELCSRHTDAAQAAVECWSPEECPPEPTWEMVGLAHREVERVRAATAPAPCDMTHQEPFDFAQCRTHDTTFALGETCKFHGREPWEVYAEEASAQRQLKVRAQLSLDRTLSKIQEWRQTHGHVLTFDELRELDQIIGGES
ncbi:hypothetical protein SEA_VANLEE_81 [Gordonia phage VanLee]|uniref:Uncharacterized protein n=1 Tax=Gordonia phage VanLee TaxID=2845816 RepID=A0A8F2D9G2_9CAUD|nr:hypothetical protein QEH49_gp081 [Gordonia phage VanLee]QWS68198.1 hypothetical protein SEA_VANLEE_81 [Gordonia phage VanLee]